MAYRRTFRRRRRLSKPRTINRWTLPGSGRRQVVRRLPRGFNTGTHHFKRTNVLSSITTSITSGVNTHQSFSFKFSDLPNYAEFTALFDQYRMNKFVIKLVPTITGAEPTSAGAAYSLPNVWSVVDYDDAVDAGNNLISLLQYPNCKMTRGHQIHTRIWKPSVLLDAYTGATEGNTIKFKQWLNMADVAIPHYGLKIWIDQCLGAVMEYRVFFTAYFSCKGVR